MTEEEITDEEFLASTSGFLKRSPKIKKIYERLTEKELIQFKKTAKKNILDIKKYKKRCQEM